MRTLLICHEGALLDQVAMANWLGSFSDLAGIVVLREKQQRKWQRISREIKRVGWWRFLDVSAFRLYYKLFLAPADARWEAGLIASLSKRYPLIDAPLLVTDSPNSAAAETFIKTKAPDLVIARCKVILAKRIFTLPAKGTFVMHPGICPEYRNAHGCFWALVRGDFDRVGMTLLRVDEGVDTGNIFGYYSYPYDSRNESHIVVQNLVVWDNLPMIQQRLVALYDGTAKPIDVSGRESRAWGHPWLTRYLQWKRRARQEGR